MSALLVRPIVEWQIFPRGIYKRSARCYFDELERKDRAARRIGELGPRKFRRRCDVLVRTSQFMYVAILISVL